MHWCPLPSRDLNDCCSILQQFIPEVIEQWKSENSESELRVIQALRTTEEQMRLYEQGRTLPGSIVTSCDGVNRLSRHQRQTFHGESACHAVDLGIFMADGTYVKNSKPYGRMAQIIGEVGLQSGKPWLDFDHAQCIVI